MLFLFENTIYFSQRKVGCAAGALWEVCGCFKTVFCSVKTCHFFHTFVSDLNWTTNFPESPLKAKVGYAFILKKVFGICLLISCKTLAGYILIIVVICLSDCAVLKGNINTDIKALSQCEHVISHGSEKRSETHFYPSGLYPASSGCGRP